MLSPYDVANIESILMGEGDWFTAQILRLISKADEYNRERLRLAYPAEVALWEKWYFKRPEYDEAFERAWNPQ